jgi:DNA polymerase-3 subunit gamma/tau
MSNQSLAVKYRPNSLKEVIGQDHVIKSLKSLISSKEVPHSYIFTGPSGTGKTTLARILAKEFNVDPVNLIESDAASFNGIDDMREITENLQYRAFGSRPNKLVILDECHALSKQAWQSLLKTVEEPPNHAFICFCTTDFSKIPDTIKTRCQTYTLYPVDDDAIFSMLERIKNEEGFTCDEKILDMVVMAAYGSPRMALNLLSMVRGCDNLEDAAKILDKPVESQNVMVLIKKIATKKSVTWAQVCGILKASDENPESIRLMVINYIASMLLNAKSDQEACRLLEMLNPFTDPFNPSEGKAPLLMAFGQLVFSLE